VLNRGHNGGPLASNPVVARLKAAGITAAAWSYGHSSRQVDDWMNTTARSRGLGVDRRTARAPGLVVVADQALVDQGKDDPDLGHVKKDYGIGEALKNDLRHYAFGAGGLDKPGAQEKRDQRIGGAAGALGTTSPSAPPPQ
jgi:hypothetical protein